MQKHTGAAAVGAREAAAAERSTPALRRHSWAAWCSAAVHSAAAGRTCRTGSGCSTAPCAAVGWTPAWATCGAQRCGSQGSALLRCWAVPSALAPPPAPHSPTPEAHDGFLGDGGAVGQGDAGAVCLVPQPQLVHVQQLRGTWCECVAGRVGERWARVQAAAAHMQHRDVGAANRCHNVARVQVRQPALLTSSGWLYV